MIIEKNFKVIKFEGKMDNLGTASTKFDSLTKDLTKDNLNNNYKDSLEIMSSSTQKNDNITKSIFKAPQGNFSGLGSATT